MSLDPTDIDALDALLAGLVLLSTPAAFRAAVLEGLRALIPCELLTYWEVDPITGAATALVFPADAMFKGAEHAWADTIEDDPFIRRYVERGDGSAARLSDLVDDETPRSKLSAFVEDDPLPGLPVMARPRISLFRRGADFSDRDRELLDAARGPVARLRRSLEGRAREPTLAARLTRREREVIGLVAQGCADAEVGRRLGISRRTVGKHLENVFAKLGVHNRAEAVHRVREPAA